MSVSLEGIQCIHHSSTYLNTSPKTLPLLKYLLFHLLQARSLSCLSLPLKSMQVHLFISLPLFLYLFDYPLLLNLSPKFGNEVSKDRSLSRVSEGRKGKKKKNQRKEKENCSFLLKDLVEENMGELRPEHICPCHLSGYVCISSFNPPDKCMR